MNSELSQWVGDRVHHFATPPDADVHGLSFSVWERRCTVVVVIWIVIAYLYCCKHDVVSIAVWPWLPIGSWEGEVLGGRGISLRRATN